MNGYLAMASLFFFFFPEVENMTDFRFILSVKGTLDQIKFNAQEYIFWRIGGDILSNHW